MRSMLWNTCCLSLVGFSLNCLLLSAPAVFGQNDYYPFIINEGQQSQKTIAFIRNVVASDSASITYIRPDSLDQLFKVAINPDDPYMEVYDIETASTLESDLMKYFFHQIKLKLKTIAPVIKKDSLLFTIKTPSYRKISYKFIFDTDPDDPKSKAEICYDDKRAIIRNDGCDLLTKLKSSGLVNAVKRDMALELLTPRGRMLPVMQTRESAGMRDR